MKVLFIRQKWKHHASKSGYDRVFQQFKGKEFDCVFIEQYRIFNLLNRIFSFLFPFWKKGNWDFNFLWSELKISYKVHSFQPDLIHFTYLQSDLKLLYKKRFRPSAKLVATLHLPTHYWETGKQSPHNFKYLDKVFVLDKISQNYFEKQPLLKGKVRLIRHPIDQEFYRPKPALKFRDDKVHCLFVGRFLRNFDLLFDIIETALKEEPHFYFHFVHPGGDFWGVEEKRFKKIISSPNVKHYSYVSDEALLRLYQSCQVLLQPLKYSTANNVILEAATCHLPVVASNQEAIRSYLDAESVLFAEDTVAGFIAKIHLAKAMHIDYFDESLSLDSIKNLLLQEYEMCTKA